MAGEKECGTKVIGYITHDVTDKFGRLLLAEGVPLTPLMIEKLKSMKVCFHMTTEPLGSQHATKQLLDPNFRETPFMVPKQLDPKFKRLDIDSIGNASKYLNIILKEIRDDLFLSNNLKAFSQGCKKEYSHSINVAIISVAIAEKMGFSKAALQQLSIGAMLHDVGTLLLPPMIIKDTSRIDDGLETIFQQHPRLGATLLAADRLPQDIYLVAQQHHEKYTGGGYPDGIKGDKIHINASIVGVADVFDRLTSSIYQRDVLSPDESLERILFGKSIAFHPLVVEQFVKLFKKDSSFDIIRPRI